MKSRCPSRDDGSVAAVSKLAIEPNHTAARVPLLPRPFIEVAIDDIHAIEGAQMRVAGTDPGTVAEYVEAMEAGAQKYLHKPLNLYELVKQIHGVTKAKRETVPAGGE